MDIKELFGVEVSQDASFLYIRKVNLLGLTPLPNNKAEQLLAAIVATAQSNFEGLLVDESGNVIVDEASNTISYDNSVLYNLTVKLWRVIPTTRNNQSFITHQYLMEDYAETN